MRQPTADALRRIDDVLDATDAHYQASLQELVRLPSLLGDEEPAQRLVADLARSAGLDVDVWEVDPASLAEDPAYAPVDGGDRPRPNVQAVLSGRGGGRSLALSGHVDVVPIAPDHHWTRAPFGAQVEGDRLYGRGALDMKGGLVAAVQAAHAVREASEGLRGDLVVESVIEEECSGNGMLATRRRGPDIDAAVIPEVSQEEIQIANPGVLWFELTVTGKPGYVGVAGQSVNAIEVATDLIAGLRSLPPDLNACFDHPAYRHAAAPLTLNVGTIHAGDWPSNVPLECVLGCRVSFPVDWDVPRAQRWVEERLRDLAADHPWLSQHPPRLRWHGFRAHGYSIEPDAPIVQTLAAAVGDVTGEPPRVGAMFGTADARYFADRGIPAVYFGPAGDGMHAPDEWVSLASVRRVARVLARTIQEWCG